MPASRPRRPWHRWSTPAAPSAATLLPGSRQEVGLDVISCQFASVQGKPGRHRRGGRRLDMGLRRPSGQTWLGVEGSPQEQAGLGGRHLRPLHTRCPLLRAFPKRPRGGSHEDSPRARHLHRRLAVPPRHLLRHGNSLGSTRSCDGGTWLRNPLPEPDIVWRTLCLTVRPAGHGPGCSLRRLVSQPHWADPAPRGFAAAAILAACGLAARSHGSTSASLLGRSCMDRLRRRQRSPDSRPSFDLSARPSFDLSARPSFRLSARPSFRLSARPSPTHRPMA